MVSGTIRVEVLGVLALMNDVGFGVCPRGV